MTTRHADRRRPGAPGRSRRPRRRHPTGPARRLVRRRARSTSWPPHRGRSPPTSAGSAPASTDRHCAGGSTASSPSEGVLPGAVQVPPDGRPVVMLADHPTTGGYPVAGRRRSGVAAGRRPGPPGHAAALPPPTVRRGTRHDRGGNDMTDRLRFGIFMAPFHQAGENPTLAIERDLDLVAHLDQLGWDEAWIGEHHSAGSEIIASPEIFIATAAERTRHIKLGTGVISVAYHNPYMVAERAVLLDHLTRGRFMLGRRAGLAADRRHHARPRPDRDPAAARGGPRRHHEAADAPRSRSPARPRRGTSSTPACTCGRTRTRCSTSPCPPWRRRPDHASPAATASACCRSARPRPPGSTPSACTGT